MKKNISRLLLQIFVDDEGLFKIIMWNDEFTYLRILVRRRFL